ncbi:MAG TPA: hypothetical protein VN956_27565 [Pyrinomonadaceae bacterium]|nr:hypothetical protein [Pyrinomonadaceae bacterium]
MNAQLLANKPTINILLYTDDPETTDDDGLFSLGTMIGHIQAHSPTFAKVIIEIICRNKDTHADNKLEAGLINKYDEIWFFGFHQSNRKTFSLGVLRGGPESELTEKEVLALTDWMRRSGNGGGVLMTGDHSQEPPPDAVPSENNLCPDTSSQEQFLGLGRAIGRCVPRAGRLRKWEGSPTYRPGDSFNTEVPVPGIDVESLRLQIDPTPQQLILRHFDQGGQPAPDGQPHPLFFYKGKSWIRVFPDHAHEGAVVLPADADYSDKGTWPQVAAIQPRAQIVAFGIDERNCQLLNILAAYNGDGADVGRIVADSTWHHYLNINLRNFGLPAPEGSAADQIGQYYSNLALWLSPRRIRQEMARVMFTWLATHPLMREEIYTDVSVIGATAYSILSTVASPCEIHELLQASVPDQYSEKFEALYFPERGFALSPLPSKELILGNVIREYQQEMIRAETSDGLIEANKTTASVDTGCKRAFEDQALQIRRIASEL